MVNDVQPNKKALYNIDKFPYGKDMLCLHVTDTYNPGYLCFDGMDRGHMIEGSIKERFSNGFIFKDNENREWTFREVTIQEYRHHIAKKVYNGANIAKLCATTEDLWEYYRKEYPDTNQRNP